MGYIINLDSHGTFRDFILDEIGKKSSGVIRLSGDMNGDDFDEISPYKQIMQVYEKMSGDGSVSDDIHEYHSGGWGIKLVQEKAPEGCDKKYLSHWRLEKKFPHEGDGKHGCSIIFAEVPERGNGKRKYCVEFSVKDTGYKEDFCLLEPLDNNRIAGIVSACIGISDLLVSEE